jgi:hypothetical protein
MPTRTIGLPRLPRLRTFTAIPRGPKLYTQPAIHRGGPGEPPPGFLGVQRTLPEWYAYWALQKIYLNPVDPRVGPFVGGWPEWEYQGHESSNLTLGGGSRVDFVVHNPGRGASPLAVRIQTEYFHQFTDAATQAYDVMQREALEAYADVVDVYDQDLVGDPTGQKAVITMKHAIGMIERANPITAGTAIRASRLSERIA